MLKPQQDPGDPPEPTHVPAEKEFLKKLVRRKFAASPRLVTPFGKTTLSWEVGAPPNPEFDFLLRLDDQAVALSGSREETITRNREYRLVATTEHEFRELGRARVNMDTAACHLERVHAIVIVGLVKKAVVDQFQGESQVKMGGDGTQVDLTVSTLSVRIPLEIEVPDWFNADMDIDVQLHIAGGWPVGVSVERVGVDVSWTLLEHLASLLCTGLVQSGMEQMAQALLLHIVQNEVAPELQRQLNAGLNELLDRLKGEDEQHRDYRPAATWFDQNGLNMTACPLPPPDGGPVIDPHA